MLEDMGFVWDSHNASWESKFNELCHFKQVHGHSFVPTMYPQNPQLAAWIKVRFIITYRGTRKGTTTPFMSVIRVTVNLLSSPLLSFFLSAVSTKAAQDFPCRHWRALWDALLRRCRNEGNEIYVESGTSAEVAADWPSLEKEGRGSELKEAHVADIKSDKCSLNELYLVQYSWSVKLYTPTVSFVFFYFKMASSRHCASVAIE